MSESKYGFYFERAGRAASQGAIAPAEQYFEGSRAEVSVVRETGQNSLDAAAAESVVRMEFELAEMPVASIPGIDDLREHLPGVVAATESSQGQGRMKEALSIVGGEVLQVLRISDYGTNGLQGSESVNDGRSPLSALTRGSGISANDGSRGGSFGIGSAVGPMASLMSSVFYTSLPAGESDVVLAGYSRLATHLDASGDWRVGDGFFTDLSITDDFRYMRGFGSFGPFAPRTEPGTDVYILAYRKAGDDPGLTHIRDAFVDNFMMAVHRGRLQVTGIHGDDRWTLTADTLPTHVRGREDAEAFYLAITDPDPIVGVSDRLGELRLHVRVDDTLSKTLHTQTMRRPLMRIDTFRHTSIPAKYAAVLVCADDEGNRILRDLEPPQHDAWDEGRAEDGASVVRELKTFVKKGLKSRVVETLGDVVEIKGLARFLPSEDVAPRLGTPARPTDGEDSGEESATVHGDSDAEPDVKNAARRAVRVKVQRTAKSPGKEATRRGRDGGGDGTRRRKGGSLEGGGDEGDGSGRISAGDIRFRSWSTTRPDRTGSVLSLALTSDENLRGDLELVPLGPGGAPEEGYDLPVSGARLIAPTRRVDLQWSGNTLKNVDLDAGQTALLELDMPMGHRYRLDVK